MLSLTIQKIAFKRVTRDILKGTNSTSLNDVLNCIAYLKRYNLDTDLKAINHLYNK